MSRDRRRGEDGLTEGERNPYKVGELVTKPTQCTIDLAHDIAAQLDDGVPFTRACKASGVDGPAHHWLKCANDPEWKGSNKALYQEFAVIVTAARERLMRRLTAKVTTDDDWRAAAWYLGVQDRQNFGKNDPVVIINAPTLPENVKVLDVKAEWERRKELEEGQD